MTRQAAARIKGMLMDCYPAADIRVSRIFGGLRFEVDTDTGRLGALITDEHSMLLRLIIEQRGLERTPR